MTPEDLDLFVAAFGNPRIREYVAARSPDSVKIQRLVAATAAKLRADQWTPGSRPESREDFPGLSPWGTFLMGGEDDPEGGPRSAGPPGGDAGGDAGDPPLPSLGTQIRNLAGSAGELIRAAARGEPVRATPEIQAARLAICRGDGTRPRCDHYRPSDDRCGRMDGCGCWLGGPLGKTAWATSRCPLEPPKWGPSPGGGRVGPPSESDG